ncbi:MAG: hypothetical protein ABIH99_04250 [Candidatus Micrarchaeota archaeon]
MGGLKGISLGLVLLLILSNLAPLASAYSSFSELEFFPVHYERYWAGYGIFGCGGVMVGEKLLGTCDAIDSIEALRINEVKFSAKETLARLERSGGKEDFAVCVNKIEQAEAGVDATKRLMNAPLKVLGKAVVEIESLCSLGFSGLPAGEPVGQYSAYCEVFPAYTEALENTALALESAGECSNEIALVLDEDMGELEEMGADYDGYSGEAAQIYAEARASLIKMEGLENGSVLVSGNEGFEEMFVRARWRAEEIQSAFEKAPAKLEFARASAVPEALDYVFGENGVLVSASAFHARLVSAKQSMEKEYATLEAGTKLKVERAKADVVEMNGNGYGKIDEQKLALFGSSGDFAGFSSTPARQYAEIEYLVNNKGVEAGAERLHGEALELKKKTAADNYLALAIERMKEADAKLVESQARIAVLKNEVEEMEVNAERIAEEEKEKAQAQLDGFEASSSYSKEIFEEAEREKEEGDKLLEDARLKKGWEKLDNCEKALENYANVSRIISPKEEFEAELKAVANSWLKKLETAINKATTDEVDVEFEKERAGVISELLNMSRNDTIVKIREEAKALVEGVYLKAGNKYAYLNGERKELLEVLEVLVDENPVGWASEAKMFAEYDRAYVVEEKFDAKLALGSFKKVADEYAELKLRMETEMGSWLKTHLHNYAEIRRSFEEIPTLDEKARVYVEIALENRMNARYSKPLAVEVKLNYAVTASNVEEKSGEISGIAFGSEKLTLFFSGVEPKKSYFVKLVVDEVLARTSSTSEKVEVLSESELRRSKDVKFNAEEEIGKLRIVDEFACRPDVVEVVYRGRKGKANIYGEEGDFYAEAIISGVEKGASGKPATLLYLTYNPYEVKKENFSATADGEKTRVSFRVEVESACEELVDAPVLVVAPANGSLIASSVSVVGLGNEVKGKKTAETNAGVAISWKVPLLIGGESAVYVVEYEVENSGEYASRLYETLAPMVGNLSSVLLESELESAKQLIDQKKNDEAVKKLLEIEEKANDLSGKNGLKRDAAFSELERMKSESAKLRELEIELKKAGLEKAGNTAGKLADEVEEFESSAERLLNDEEIEKAALELAKAEKKLKERGFVDSIIAYSKETLAGVGAVKEREMRVYWLNGANYPSETLGEAEHLWELANEQIGNESYAEALRTLAEVKGKAQEAESKVAVAAEAVFDEYAGRSSEFAETRALALEKLAEVKKALKVSVGSKVPTRGAPVLSVDADALESEITSATKHLDNVFASIGKTSNKTKYVVENAENLWSVSSELGKLEENAEIFGSELSALNESAGKAIATTYAALKQLKGSVPEGNSQYASELGKLNANFAEARDAQEEGKYADSLLLSAYVQDRSNYLMKELQPAKNTGNGERELWIAGLSLAFLVLLVVLFIKRKKPEKNFAKILRQKD